MTRQKIWRAIDSRSEFAKAGRPLTETISKVRGLTSTPLSAASTIFPNVCNLRNRVRARHVAAPKRRSIERDSLATVSIRCGDVWTKMRPDGMEIRKVSSAISNRANSRDSKDRRDNNRARSEANRASREILRMDRMREIVVKVAMIAAADTA